MLKLKSYLNMIKVEDFVILKTVINNLEVNSVGIVKAINLKIKSATVFFIGKRKEIQISLDKIEFLDISKTGKPYKYKICNICHVLKKDIADFDINQTDAKGRKTTRPSCKACRVNIDGVGLNRVEKKKLDDSKPTHFFICPICKKPSIPHVTANLVKDHDHITGKAREWLCDSCNTGLGRFKDNIDLLKKAIAYLEKHNASQKNQNN